MAKPQLENGYTRISNEILDAFIGSRITIPAEVRRVVDFIVRKTYGWGKKEDCISLSQFALATGLKKPSVIRAIKKALSMGIISRTANRIAWKYRFIKDFTNWKPLAPRLIISPTANASLAPRLPTKETNTKETTIGFSNQVKKMNIYNENNFSDSYEKKIDTNGNAVIKEKKEKPATDPVRLAAERLLKLYYAGHKRRVGGEIPFYPKSAYLRQARPIINKYGIDKLEKLLDAYFNAEDKGEIYKKNKYSISCFLSWKVLNQLDE